MTIAATHEGPLGIICGSGSIPPAVAAAVQRRGRRVLLFALRGFADARAMAPFPHCWIAIGQFGRFRRLARAQGCRDIVLWLALAVATALAGKAPLNSRQIAVHLITTIGFFGLGLTIVPPHREAH